MYGIFTYIDHILQLKQPNVARYIPYMDSMEIKTSNNKRILAKLRSVRGQCTPQPKQFTVIRKIPQDYHTFKLFDSPKTWIIYISTPSFTNYL